MNKLDLVFEREPPEVKRKLMNLLIEYNATLQYNQKDDKFQVDLLLPFKNTQQKDQFINNFNSRESRRTSQFNTQRRDGHVNGDEENKYHSLEGEHYRHNHQNYQQKQHSNQHQNQHFHTDDHKQNGEQEQQAQISLDFTNEYQMSKRRKTISMRDISSIIHKKIRGAVTEIQQSRASPKFETEDEDKQFKIKMVPMEHRKQNNKVLSQYPLDSLNEKSQSIEAHSFVENWKEKDSALFQEHSQWDMDLQSRSRKSGNSVQNQKVKQADKQRQIKFQKEKQKEREREREREKEREREREKTQKFPRSSSAQPSHPLQRTSSKSKADRSQSSYSQIKNEILIEQQLPMISRKAQPPTHFQNNEDSEQFPHIIEQSYSAQSKQYETEPMMQQEQHVDYLFKPTNSHIQHYPKAQSQTQSNTNTNVQMLKQRLVNKYNTNRPSQTVRQRYNEFMKKNHRDFDRIYDTIRREIKRKGKDGKQIKSTNGKMTSNFNTNSNQKQTKKQQDPILVLESQTQTGTEQQKIFKQQIIKDYQKYILVNNLNMSSEDLVRYFRYLLQHARNLYVKHLRHS